MSTISDVRNGLESLDFRQSILDTANTNLEAADAAVAALITTEQAALDAANAAFIAARASARTSTGWDAVFAAQQSAQADRDAAYADFETAVTQWEP